MKHIIETHCNEETILHFAQGWGWTYSGSGLLWTALRRQTIFSWTSTVGDEIRQRSPDKNFNKISNGLKISSEIIIMIKSVLFYG